MEEIAQTVLREREIASTATPERSFLTPEDEYPN